MMGERRMMQQALFHGFSFERHAPDNHMPRRTEASSTFRTSGCSLSPMAAGSGGARLIRSG